MPGRSSSLADIVASFKRNRVGMKGILTVSVFTGEISAVSHPLGLSRLRRSVKAVI